MSQNFNFEIKAYTSEHDSIREFLISQKAVFRGVDHQIDTYFPVKHGRLKIREGNIENCIVHYDRKNESGPKLCKYKIIHFKPNAPVLRRLKEILIEAIGVLTVVDKKREIYFLRNTKFHLDTVKGLGKYFEIEVIDAKEINESVFRKQCEKYLEELEIKSEQLMKGSYSDIILEIQQFT